MTTRSIPEHMLLPSTCQSGLRHLVNARWDSQAVRNGSHSPRASCGVIQSREMVSFDSSEAPIAVQASELKDALFVLGSDELHLGYYSGHISAQALEQGVRRIAEQGKKLNVVGSVVQRQEQFRYFAAAIVISRLRHQPLRGILSSRACHTAECQMAPQPPNNQ